jgi:hypothetical protein
VGYPPPCESLGVHHYMGHHNRHDHVSMLYGIDFVIVPLNIPYLSFDFVMGLLLGIIMASLFFVVQNSRRKAIRAVFNGSTAKSTVRRPHAQRAFIQDVGKQTVVMKLQGFRKFEARKRYLLSEWLMGMIMQCFSVPSPR